VSEKKRAAEKYGATSSNTYQFTATDGGGYVSASPARMEPHYERLNERLI
jgi:hypothetical protein